MQGLSESAALKVAAQHKGFGGAWAIAMSRRVTTAMHPSLYASTGRTCSTHVLRRVGARIRA
eukprot:363221-Chlamydomonas_euryale.AAC.17